MSQEVDLAVLNASGILKRVSATNPLPVSMQTPAGIATGNPGFYSFTQAHGAYATPTDFVSLTNPVGSVKKLLLRFASIGMRSTSATAMTLFAYKRLLLATGGAFTAAHAVEMNSNDPNSTGVVKLWTAAPVVNDGGADIMGFQILTTTVLTSTPTVAFLSTMMGGSGLVAGLTDMWSPFILQPGEEFSFGLNGAAIPSGFSCTPYIQWAEI